MKKVVNITIGGVVFNVEDDAFKKLSHYLDTISEHLSKDDDKDEIISDIEISIAEKFSAKKRPANSAITMIDVENVIDAMGSPKDFKEVADQDPSHQNEEENFNYDRKLYRDADDKIIAGVASGLGAYFGVDSVIARLIFFVSIFFGGFGVILYIVLWIIVKPAETTAQKLNMRGEKINFKEIEKSVKEGVENIKKKDLSVHKNLRSFLDKFFKLIGKLVNPFMDFIRILVGVSLVIAGISGVFVLSFGIAWMLSGADIPYTTYVVSDFIVLSEYMFVLFNFSVYYVVLYPLILLSVCGISLLKRKMITSGAMMLILLVIWFAALGFIGSVFMQNAENIENQVRIIEDQESHNQNIKVEIDEDGQVRRVEISAPETPDNLVLPPIPPITPIPSFE
jgi:phage shock protein PspC (stress-responsive transcriptional regulator)